MIGEEEERRRSTGKRRGLGGLIYNPLWFVWFWFWGAVGEI